LVKIGEGERAGGGGVVHVQWPVRLKDGRAPKRDGGIQRGGVYQR